MTATACLRLASSFKRFSSLRACERGRKKEMNVERREIFVKSGARSSSITPGPQIGTHNTPLPAGIETLCLLLVKTDGHCWGFPVESTFLFMGLTKHEREQGKTSRKKKESKSATAFLWRTPHKHTIKQATSTSKRQRPLRWGGRKQQCNAIPTCKEKFTRACGWNEMTCLIYRIKSTPGILMVHHDTGINTQGQSKLSVVFGYTI